MQTQVIQVADDDVLPLRELHRKAMNCQIILDSWHRRGWTDCYLFQSNGRTVGYGLVGGRDDPKQTITEFFVLPIHWPMAVLLFEELVAKSGATMIEVQTNDILLTLMLYDFGTEIEYGPVLFHDALTTNLAIPNALFREARASDAGKIFNHNDEPIGGWLIEAEGCIVATGGVLFHYNPPYGDIYMEVDAPHRRKGYGSYLVQELKRVAYEMGKVPAARCNPTNKASRATLQRAGLHPCARLVTGKIVGEV